MLRTKEIRKDFPILERKIAGRPLIYLDNAATTQMPVQVMQAMQEQYCLHNANVHRGIHTLSNESTLRLENARRTAAAFIGAEAEEVVFTFGTTDSLNLLAQAFRQVLRPGDEVVTTVMEHHSNYVPWQMLCRQTGASFKVCPITETGELDLEVLEKQINARTKIVTAPQVSNVLGTVNPAAKIAQIAHAAGAMFVLDGAQGIRHGVVDVKNLDCDFYAFSGHKMLGPGGTGALYGRKSLFAALTPPRFGGGMVDTVTEAETTFEPAPQGWEAGTGNFQGSIGLAAAMDYLTALGREDILKREQALTDRVLAGLSAIPGVRVPGHPAKRCGVVSFVLQDIHSFDAAALLDKLGIALRSGTHCAQPLMAALGVENTLRVSPAFYNTEEEIDRFLEGLERVRGILL